MEAIPSVSRIIRQERSALKWTVKWLQVACSYALDMPCGCIHLAIWPEFFDLNRRRVCPHPPFGGRKLTGDTGV